MDVYATADELKARVAPGGASSLDDRLNAAVVLGTQYVDRRLGNPFVEEYAEPPYTLTRIECPPSWSEATLAAAAYYYKLPDAPMGYIGGLADYAVKVRASGDIATADAILFGQIPILVA